MKTILYNNNVIHAKSDSPECSDIKVHDMYRVMFQDTLKETCG